MKQLLIKLAARVDAMSLRERALMFAAVAAVIVFGCYTFMLGPLFARQAILKSQVSQNQNVIAGMDDEITKKVTAYAIDPNEANRNKLAASKAEVEALSTRLRAMQNGLVAPEKMAFVLEAMLKANTRLQLTAMKTLPSQPMAEGIYLIPNEATPAPAPGAPVATAPQPLPKPGYLLYRHGVKLTVRGSYLDMIAYMGALETMPTRLFWDKVAMTVEQYPNASLTMTVYTLSLDQKWIQL